MKGIGIVVVILTFLIFPSPSVAQTPVPGAAITSGSGRATVDKPAGKPAVASPLFATPRKPIDAAAALGGFSMRVGDAANSAGAHAASQLPSAARWIPITVVNKHGGPASGVSAKDFVVVEDGHRQQVTALERWPLWLVVVFDVGRQVGPMKQLSVHRQLVYDLLYALGEDDRVAVVQYADGMDVIQPFTLNVREAEASVNERFQSGLEGQLWNSVAYSAGELLNGKLGHRAILVITDGVDDTGDTIAYEGAVKLLRETATSLYIVNLSRYLEEQIKQEAYGMNGVLNVITSPSYIGRRRQLRDYHERIGEAPPMMVKATSESGGQLWHVAPNEDAKELPVRVWNEIGGQMMARIAPEREGEARSNAAVRSYSVFPTRGDVDVRSPTRLYAQIASPQAARPGTKLTRSVPKTGAAN